MVCDIFNFFFFVRLESLHCRALSPITISLILFPLTKCTIFSSESVCFCVQHPEKHPHWQHYEQVHHIQGGPEQVETRVGQRH